MNTQDLSTNPSELETGLLATTTDSKLTAPLSGFRQFVRQNLIGSVTTAIAGSLLLAGVSTWNLWSVYRGFRTTVYQQFQLEKLSGQIVHLDEVLTMSARMAASTGNLQWEKRYKQYEPELIKAIEDTLKGVSPEIRSEASKTDQANAKLVEMETQAFALVRQGKSADALALLLGPQYSQYKQTYSEGNQRVLAQIEQSIQKQLQDYQQGLLGAIGFSGVTLAVLVGAWILILLAIRDYIEERQAAQAALQQSEVELTKLNESLLAEVGSRAQKEQEIQSSSDQLQEDIAHLLDVVCAIEEGDLTTQAEVNDRATGLVGDTLNRLVEELGRVLSNVSTVTERVASSSSRQEEIAAAVASSTGQQAQSVVEVLKLTEEVRQAAQRASLQLVSTNQSLLTLQGAVETGQVEVQTLNEGITVLQQGSDRIVQQIKTLGEFVGLADQFVQTQSDIATQTQILALNASLVAARAAEQRDPQQFSLVAREFESIAAQIGELAQQTNKGLTTLEQQSSQIHIVVSDVDAQVQKLGGLVDRFTQSAKKTRDLYDSVQEVAQEAVSAGEDVAQTSEDIALASQETSQAMNAITQLSQQIAEQSQFAQSISEKLNHLSVEAVRNIQVFKLPSIDAIGDGETAVPQESHQDLSMFPTDRGEAATATQGIGR
jgi:methyl-accepting chemotaxis protein PixJ